jgi:hypothetical protein
MVARALGYSFDALRDHPRFREAAEPGTHASSVEEGKSA